MKTLSIFGSSTKASAAVVASLLLLGLQHSALAQFAIPDPPSTPTPTYYGDFFTNPDNLPGLSINQDTGSQVEYGPLAADTSEYELEDWNILTPFGTLTPDNSTLTGETYGTANPYSPGAAEYPGGYNGTIGSDFYTSPTMIPLEDLNFSGTGSLAGDTFSIAMGNYASGAGSITATDASGNTTTSYGVWSTPDASSTLGLMLVASGGLMLLARRQSDFGRAA